MNKNQYPSSLEDLVLITKDLIAAETMILENIENGFDVSHLSICNSLSVVAEKYMEQILEKMKELNLYC